MAHPRIWPAWKIQCWAKVVWHANQTISWCPKRIQGPSLRYERKIWRRSPNQECGNGHHEHPLDPMTCLDAIVAGCASHWTLHALVLSPPGDSCRDSSSGSAPCWLRQGIHWEGAVSDPRTQGQESSHHAGAFGMATASRQARHCTPVLVPVSF